MASLRQFGYAAVHVPPKQASVIADHLADFKICEFVQGLEGCSHIRCSCCIGAAELAAAHGQRIGCDQRAAGVMVQAEMAWTVAGRMNDGNSTANGQKLATCERLVHSCFGRMSQHMQKSPLPLL